MRDDLYSIERANAALPLVRAIVTDIVDLNSRVAEATAAYRQLKALSEGSQVELNRAQRTLGELVTQRDECVAELALLGVQIGDGARGICDFPAEIDGERVYLCWELGEERVEYYHALDAGFGGRTLLPIPAPVG
jgi:hypothetical protein